MIKRETVYYYNIKYTAQLLLNIWTILGFYINSILVIPDINFLNTYTQIQNKILIPYARNRFIF